MIIRTIARRLRGVSSQISRDEALARAAEECAKRGWRWVEPIHVSERLLYFRIWTNARSRGGNASIKISVEDGSVLSAHITPR
jgi:hypothetical protein